MKDFNFYVFDDTTGRTIVFSLEKREHDDLYVVLCISYLRLDFDHRELLKRVFKDYDDACEFYISLIKMLTL